MGTYVALASLVLALLVQTVFFVRFISRIESSNDMAHEAIKTLNARLGEIVDRMDREMDELQAWRRNNEPLHNRVDEHDKEIRSLREWRHDFANKATPTFVIVEDHGRRICNIEAWLKDKELNPRRNPQR